MKKETRKKAKGGAKSMIYFSLFILLVGCLLFVWYFHEGMNQQTVVTTPLASEQATSLNASEHNQQDSPWQLLLVNKEHAIPSNYTIKLRKVSGGERVDERIYTPLMSMLEEAKKANLGELPIVVAGYRSQEQQEQILKQKIAEFEKTGYSNKEAKQQASQWAALPGYSEHQIGLAVDLNGATYDLYPWLQENSYKYGFILRYPSNKTEITSISGEIWHYRYVGVKVATEIYKNGLCLEEYLGEV
ncbi:MAG: M15 family metallopeptidase [Enterococcus lacertideformus]|uniref:M15 family metallopeptidase n=1 Tax=Enterococcus lacertideformus TaxID=2771493 RepID=A0A931B2L7_9ENTE|nr:M15 family metallopeptidase [Enterococcus lacertideformus]